MRHNRLLRALLMCVAAVLLVGGAYMTWQARDVAAARAEVSQEVGRLSAENADRQRQNDELRRQISDARENPDAVFEELAREKLMMIQRDEVYILLPEKTDTPGDNNAGENTPAAPGE